MSDRHDRRAGQGADELADASFDAGAERAESAWLQAREHDPYAVAPSAQIARDHAELEHLLGALPASSDERWHDEVLRKVRALPSSRPWWRRSRARWSISGAVAAAIALVLLVRARPHADELDIAISHVDRTRSAPEEVVVGDRLVVTARAPAAGDLRVYRAGDALVARCPGGPRCTATPDGEQIIEITLDAPVSYQVVLVVGRTELSPGGTLAALMSAARTANVRVLTPAPIDVR